MPFNSTNKYALSIVNQEGPDHHYVSYIKGAPEKVWKYCGRILHEGKYKTIGPEERKNFEAVNLRFGKNGERVLGFAMLPLNKETYGPDYGFVTSKPDNFNFPMENYIFVGLVSLMDPPKETVPFAIKKCQSAGIKVIMVTGDQPPTAAAIAKQIGIITLKTNEDLKQEGYSPQEALEKANAIVIHGDMLTKAFQEGDELGNEILSAWVRKPQICFARTTPAQKLQIVTACQNAGNVVGVTGDGVNDSPAIKQGDIGISMGISGSDVTKDAADMILLNDDFASIVEGVEEGRKIFDNLKKTIVYLLTSNMTEIWPFVALVVLQVPLPLSNIFMLCICVGTDIYPALSLAYEQAEVDIMTRRPRKPDEHLVSARLLVHAYGQMGQIATAGGFFTYFTIMNLYGLHYNNIFNILSIPAATPISNLNSTGGNNASNYVFSILNNTPYIYNASLNTGNASIAPNCSENQYSTNFPNWISDVNDKYDLRGAYLKCSSDNFNYTNALPNPWPDESLVLGTNSTITGLPVAYTTEMIFYAQSGYFVTVVLVQWSNVFACKSRKVSLIYSGFNMHMFLGILVETILFVFLLYVPGVNQVFGGRPLDFFLLGIPGLGFSMLLLIWEETRKLLMNLDTNHGKPNWWQRNLLW